MREVLVKTEEFKDSPVGKIPKDWEVKKLGELANNRGEYGSGAAALEFNSDLPRYVRITDITDDGNLNPNSRASINRPNAEGYYLQKGDLLFARSGATVGKTYLYDEDDGECAHAGYVIKFSLDSSVCEPCFVSQWTRSSFYWTWVKQTLRQGAQPNINAEEYKSVNLPYPPVDEQGRIAEILDTVDEAIARTSSLIIKLKLTKAGLLQDLLTRGLDEDGKLRDPQAHPEHFKDSPLGRIPTDWEVHRLKSKQNPNYPYIKTGPFGSSLKGEHWVEQGVPVITIGAIGEGEFIISELLFISEAKAKTLSTYAVKEGDLVFSRVADVGRSVVVSKPQEGWIMSSNLMRISLDQYLVEPIFAYLNIVDNNLTRQQIRQFVNSGGREIANTAILDSLQFCWTSKEEQIRIIQVAKTYDTRIRAEEAYLNKLKLQKQGLMQDLLTGQSAS